jgi:predicted NBD/HSP70 family sugar kinase
MEIKNTKTLKEHNKRIILTEIINRQPISRPKLSDYLDVSHTTISNLINELKKQGLVIEKRSDSTGGRPPKLLSFNGENKYTLSLLFKSRVILIGLFNLNNNLLDKQIIKVKNDSFEDIMKQLEKVTISMRSTKNIKSKDVLGVGGSIPGIYQKTKDKIINSNIDYLPNLHLKRRLQKTYEFSSIYIDNFANIEAFYEWNDHFLREYSNLLYIIAEDEIDSGLIINNELYKGSFEKAGDIEHLIVNPEGKKCACGKQGCLITTSSIKDIEDNFNEALWKGAETNIDEMFESPYGYKKIIRAYLKEDPLSKKIIDDSLKYFSIAFTNMIKTIDPQTIILGGLFDEFDDTMVDELNHKLQDLLSGNEDSYPNLLKRKDENNFQLKAINSYIFHQLKTKLL